MKEKKKNEPILGPAERENPDGTEAFSLTNAASAAECTGLIQVPPACEEQLENYAEVCSFAQPKAIRPQDGKSEQIKR